MRTSGGPFRQSGFDAVGDTQVPIGTGMKWMLDTDTCIAIIKRQPPSALKKLRGKSIGQVGLSSMTLGELAYGAAKSVRPQAGLELPDYGPS